MTERIATIDFEASGLRGYPIEVGIAIFTPGNPEIHVWSSLIRPTTAWQQTLPWDMAAYSIHGISREDLETAPSAWDVASKLNALLAPVSIAYCDGYTHDLRWLHLLIQECPDPCSFDLQDAGRLAKRLDIMRSALFERDDAPIAHRAGHDAEQLLRRALALAGEI